MSQDLYNIVVGVAGTYGNATTVGQFTVDAQGRITSASNVTISGGGGILYVQGGALKYRGSSGTVTTIAPA